MPPILDYMNPLSMDSIRHDIREKGNLDLMELLRTLKEFTCTDPKDRIYRVLRLTKGKSGPWLDVNYSLSVEENLPQSCRGDFEWRATDSGSAYVCSAAKEHVQTQTAFLGF